MAQGRRQGRGRAEKGRTEEGQGERGVTRKNEEEEREGSEDGGGRREVADTGFLPYNYFGLYFWFIYFTRAHKPVVFARGKGSLRQGGGGRSPRGKSTTKMNRI